MNQALYYYFVLEVARNFGQGEGFKSLNASHLSAFLDATASQGVTHDCKSVVTL